MAFAKNQPRNDVILFDAQGNAMAVHDGVAVPVDTPHYLVGGRGESDSFAYHMRMRDDVTTPAIKRMMVEAAIAPGSTITTTSGATAGTGAISERLLNGSSFNMVVDGSGGPITFQFDADPDNDIQLTSLRLVFSASSFQFDGNAFGRGGGPLGVGVSLDIVSDDGAFAGQLSELIVNEDFLRLLDFEISQAGSTDVMAASIPFSGNVLLVAGSSDNISVTINDALDAGNRGITYFTSTVYGVEVD